MRGEGGVILWGDKVGENFAEIGLGTVIIGPPTCRIKHYYVVETLLFNAENSRYAFLKK